MILNSLRNILIDKGYASKPSFIIVGAQKAGTTSLFSILKQHSQLKGSHTKEVHFFDDEEKYSEKNYSWYHQFFPLPHKIKKDTLLFEATPSYIYHTEAAKRIYEYNSKMKIIIVLRNPVYRALSAWNMYHHYGSANKKYTHMQDKRSFKVAIEDELEKIEQVNRLNDKISYVKRGVYYPQVKKYLDTFSKKNVLIIEHDQLKNYHNSAIKEITSFLEIKNEILKPLELLKSIQSNEKLYTDELIMLNQFYKPHNQMLYNLIGIDYNWNLK